MHSDYTVITKNGDYDYKNDSRRKEVKRGKKKYKHSIKPEKDRTILYDNYEAWLTQRTEGWFDDNSSELRKLCDDERRKQLQQQLQVIDVGV